MKKKIKVKENIYKRINHERIIPYLVKCIQELSEKIEKLEQKLN